MVMAIDDEACMSLIRLFNEPAGRAYLVEQGVPEELVGQLDLLGISSIANVLSAIKFAKWYELGEHDIVLTVLTDSMELYGSRLHELHEEHGEYTEVDAAADYHRYLLGCTMDYVEELGYWDRKRIHNLKYFTWVEQQGKTYEEIQAQWYDPDYWTGIHGQVDEIDALIEQFNEMTGLIERSVGIVREVHWTDSNQTRKEEKNERQTHFRGRDFITLLDWTKEEVEQILDLALDLKQDRAIGRLHDDLLRAKTLFMIFYNQSLRTRNSFEAGHAPDGRPRPLFGSEQDLYPGAGGQGSGLQHGAGQRRGPGAGAHGRGHRHPLLRRPGGLGVWRANALLHEFANWSDDPDPQHGG